MAHTALQDVERIRGEFTPSIIEDFIFSPVLRGTSLTLPLADVVGGKLDGGEEKYIQFGGKITALYDNYTCKITVTRPDSVISTAKAYKEIVGINTAYFDGDDYFKVDFDIDGTYLIEYYLDKHKELVGNNDDHEARLTFKVIVTNRKKPLKKWTILDVINRCFDVIEPLKYGQKPRFRLKGVQYDNKTGNVDGYRTGSLAEKLDKILAPEFVFTKMNLREQLKEIGGFIHGEPRVCDIRYDDDGTMWFEVDFDMYGGNKTSNISKRRYVSATFGTDINEYCTSLDSSAENLINQLNWAQGVIIEPFNGGGKSLRTEQIVARITDDNSAIIATDYPIYALGDDKRIYCTYIPGIGQGKWDITPFIYEKADYDLLSSYSDIYPRSKAYALYYTQGQKNIKGLFFKTDHALSSIFNRYAIYNILTMVTGQEPKELVEKLIAGEESRWANYMELAFQVHYLPIYSARIKTNKQLVVGGFPSTIAYNQGANLIESQYYGENLKGAVARLGNVEKTYTYNVAFLSDIPQIGTKFDKNYYISAVSTEYLPTYIKVTVALSKDFNRLSQYVGINSEKRMWEVSEKQSFERETIITEYVLITTDENITKDSKVILTMEDNIVKALLGTIGTASSAEVRRFNKQKNEENEEDEEYEIHDSVNLPLVSTAMGNSMIFTFRFEDNYSAGQKSVPLTTGNISGYWGAYVPYCDYYGRFYYLGFLLKNGVEEFEIKWSDGTILKKAKTSITDLPQGCTYSSDSFANSIISTSENATAIKYRKDSREVPSITYELQAVTDNESIIIGSALMKNCGLVNSKPIETLEWYGFTRPLNVLDSKIDLTYATKIVQTMKSDFNSARCTLKVPFSNSDYNSDYVAWALVTKVEKTDLSVEDEYGEQTTQPIYDGGELIIGQNERPSGQTLYFRVKSKIYD